MMDIREYLRSLTGETIHYLPNPGNAGDALIAHATFQLFRECGVRYLVIGRGDDLRGKVVAFGGGGNFVRYYSACAEFVRAHHRRAKKLVVLPHTVDGHEDLLRELGPNVDIICRELTSFHHVKRHAGGAGVFLMHDLAFSLDVGRTFDEIGRCPSILVDPGSFGNSVRMVKQHLRYRAAMRARGRRARADGASNGGRLNCFRTDREKTTGAIPPDNLDLSSLFVSPRHGRGRAGLVEPWAHVTAHRLLTYMQPFDEIHTNRLHLAIAGILLDKRVCFHSNVYWKNRSVYHYSMKDRFPKVTWVAPEGEESPTP